MTKPFLQPIPHRPPPARLNKFSNPSQIMSRLLMARAAIHEQQGDAAAAKIIYEKVLTIFPGFAPAKKRLVIFFADNPGDDKKTTALAVSAREALPNDPELAGLSE